MIKPVYVKKTISILEEQEAWVEDNTISLSRFVQNALNNAMKLKTRTVRNAK